MDEYRKLLEQRLAEAEAADVNAAPFGMTADEARCWHSGRATAYQYALEMLPTHYDPDEWKAAKRAAHEKEILLQAAVIGCMSDEKKLVSLSKNRICIRGINSNTYVRTKDIPELINQ